MYPDTLKIKQTRRSPKVVMNNERIFIMGRSIIENPSTFYEPVINWIREFSKSWTGKTKIDLGFEYINTGSTKWLYIILRELSAKRQLAENVEIRWHFERGDEDMCELGLIIRSLVNCPFSFIEVNSMNDRFYEEVSLTDS
ncbi:MAG TPA: DUF1987 domain-containing protein [Bacteroidales bacterium]|jgi:hypothetical protein|nr:MAG: hypothetical protein BWX96_00593 [Bacteroidetes bacterium ADurb.Bin145]HOU02579.1 DUF1987 domain-containing protein [Bacteroidales bacterium]HQG62631.1 DUF1987 domain-containing protein [Bacteroidales bacterium]HQK66558.1 DUF1987 domain-containing protein [Bacteroidales bacterium]